jgi:protein gp37
MAQISKIEWTQSSWNPVTGCSKVSLGCRNCYAERLAKRLQRMGQPRYKNGFEVTLHEDLLDIPLRWKKPRIIFVNSMSDIFHGDVPDSYIKKIFKTMNEASWHTFQILTKRSKRMVSLADKLNWSSNIWMGVTVENSRHIDRIYDLQVIPSAVKFLSLEPLLGAIPEFPSAGIDWVIVGGESGPGARIMEKSWPVEIRNYCVTNKIPFFFKQWGGVRKHQNGRLLEGKLWSEYPEKDITIKNQFRYGV